ncbi:MAG: hypothetical protein ACRDV9_14140 [Acidimicrobiia bacterium]
MLDRVRRQRESRRRKAQRDAAAQRHGAWIREHRRLEAFLETARSPEGRSGAEGRTPLGEGELLYHSLAGSLVKAGRAPSQPVGLDEGWGPEVVGRVLRREGTPPNAYVQRENVPPPVDSGRILVTSRRVLFEGRGLLREWRLSELDGVVHDAELPWTALQTDDDGSISGLSCDAVAIEDFRFRLALAVALAGESPTAGLAPGQARARLIQIAEARVAAHEAERPAVPDLDG